MIKLYKRVDDSTFYWETWEDEGVHTVHWGPLGKKGRTKKLRSTQKRDADELLRIELEKKRAEGFAAIATEHHRMLLIEFNIGTTQVAQQLDKRHRLQEWLDETLGWTGLGHCDGGSIGGGTMEAGCFVVDVAIATHLLERKLKGTEFADYARIFESPRDQ